MKDFEVKGFSSKFFNQAVYIPFQGALVEATLKEIRLVSYEIGQYIEANFQHQEQTILVRFSPQGSSQPIYLSVADYEQNKPTSQATGCAKSVLINLLNRSDNTMSIAINEPDGDVRVCFYYIEGKVVKLHDKSSSNLSFIKDNDGKWQCETYKEYGKTYISMPEARWENDFAEVLQDGTTILHEATGKPWELNEIQKQGVAELAAVLNKLAQNKVCVMFDTENYKLQYFSYDQSGIETSRTIWNGDLDSYENTERVPEPAIHDLIAPMHVLAYEDIPVVKYKAEEKKD